MKKYEDSMSLRKIAFGASLLALSGCSSLTPDISLNNMSPMAEYYRARFNVIDNYYAGDYYIAEYYINDTNRSYCSDGYCYKGVKRRHY